IVPSPAWWAANARRTCSIAAAGSTAASTASWPRTGTLTRAAARARARRPRAARRPATPRAPARPAPRPAACRAGTARPPRSRRPSPQVSARWSGRGLYRALALAADDLERHLALPVDEVVHRLQAELHGHGQVADLVLERRRADALGVGVEHLAVGPLRLVLA